MTSRRRFLACSARVAGGFMLAPLLAACQGQVPTAPSGSAATPTSAPKPAAREFS